MIRMNFTLTPNHGKALKAESRKQQISMSELLRKIIDAYFNRKEK